MSARHLSFVESGRASASRELLLRLGEQLTMPLRDRNRLLVAGGYAPVFNARTLDDPDMEPALAAISSVLDASAPTPPWWSIHGGIWSARINPRGNCSKACRPA